MTLKSLKQAADQDGTRLSLDDSQFALELLNPETRGSLMDKFDQDSRGNLDGKIDRQNIQNFIKAGRGLRHSVAEGSRELPTAVAR